MISQHQLTTFEQLVAMQRITPVEAEIFRADLGQPIKELQHPEKAIKDVMRRFFTLYGINPAVQFSDTEFKNGFVSEMTGIITKHYPAITAEAFFLSIELNLTNWFGLIKAPQVYGDRITAEFLISVLNIYRSKKGSIIQKIEKMLPEPQPEVDQEKHDADLEEILRTDIRNRADNPEHAITPLTGILYDYLFRTGRIQETDDMLRKYYILAKEVAESFKSIGKMKECSPISIKELDITRRFLRTVTNIADIAKQLACEDYINDQAKLRKR